MVMHKILSVLSLIGSLGTFVPLTIIPVVAQAQTKPVELRLNAQNQNFKTLIQQAEAVAKNTIEQSFLENPNLTAVSLTVIGEHNGTVAPILSTNVSRLNWQQKPTIQAWSQYFTASEILLGFLKPQTTPSGIPSTNFNNVAASMTDKESNFYQ
jgi:hypothetical protein